MTYLASSSGGTPKPDALSPCPSNRGNAGLRLSGKKRRAVTIDEIIRRVLAQSNVCKLVKVSLDYLRALADRLKWRIYLDTRFADGYRSVSLDT